MKQTKIDRKEIEDVIGLTAMQEGMLFHAISDPKSRQYVEQFRFRLTGSLNEDYFRRAWDAVVRAHEMLRSIVRWRQLEEPVQIVLKHGSVPIEWLDWSTLPAEEVRDILERWVAEDYRRPVELDRHPLRVALVCLPEQQAEMILTFHHILFDGWSNGLLLSDFLEAYAALDGGGEPAIPRRTKYKEFYKWYRRQDKEERDEFWREYMAGFDTLTPLPYDFPKLEEIKEKATFHFNGAPALVEALEECGRRFNVTLSALLYACWGLLLQKYTNSGDVVFGTTVAGRPPAVEGVEEMVGMFINTLPVRIKALKDDPALEVCEDLAAHLNRRTLFEHTSLTDIKRFTNIANEQNLFDSLVVIDNYPLQLVVDERSDNQHPVIVRSFQLNEMTNFDITVQLLHIAQPELALHYNATLFSRSTIETLGWHLVNILNAVIADPRQPLSSISMISDLERRQVLEQFNRNDVSYVIPQTIPMEFLRAAHQHPRKEAVRWQTDTVTYEELRNHIEGLAALLRSYGVEPGHRVVLLFPRSIEMVAGMMAILAAGAVCVPLDVSYPVERNQLIIQDSDAKFILRHSNLDQAADHDLTVIDYHLGMDLGGRTGEPVEYTVDPTDLAYLIYTSGSTGKPKGAMLHHSGIVNHTLTKMDVLGINDKDVVANNFSINVIASIWQVLAALFAGATLVVHGDEVEQDPYLQFQRVAADGVSVIEVIPSILKSYLFLMDEGKEKIELPRLRKIALTSEETKPALVNKFYGLYGHIDLVDCYGQTECCDDVLHYTIPRSTDTKVVPIGTPSFNTRIFILNHHNQLQPMGLPGEICVSGAGVGNGYWNRLELSREKFVDNPIHPGIKMYRTGDLGKWLPDGNVAYLGRLDHQVKVRGNRIELREIETVMASHRDILEAAVVTKQDHHGETVLHAFFVANRDITVAEIRHYLGQTLPDYMVPGFFTKLERMPQTPNMKIDRKKLKTMEGTIATGTAFKPPRNQLEKQIQEIWKQLLGRDDIGIHDNFFDLGGHSLLLIKLKSRLEKSFSRDIQLVDLFKYPTIALLAELVSGDAAEDDDVQIEVSSKSGGDVAVIGISLQVPGASDIHGFWRNIKDGVQSISNFSEEELETAPLNGMIRGNCRLVPHGGVLGDVDLFDAGFFGYTPGEAEVIDPQQRLFLEYCLKALEDAGYGNASQLGYPVGVYGGVGFNTYLLNNLMSRPDVVNRYGEFQIMIANDKDFLASRVAYKLNLKGPALTVQSACSTSLVVAHIARQGLLAGDCRLAVAGGVAVRVPEKTGYFYTEGGHLSPDGTCRAFSAESNGTVFGNGVGVVVMKRLAEAEADGDHIYALIKSSGINNDGSLKVGFTSPGEQGQADVVHKTLQAAAIDPETVTYIETHGTGTVLGDPIEVSALTSAFRRYTGKKGFCAIGSVKPNIGHLDAAAGIVGMIKAILCLKHKQIPPSIHVNDLNPNIDFQHSPFYVNTELKDWPADGKPRRAGCSSLGIGGTNAHIILEEYQEPPADLTSRPWHIVAMSAKSRISLDRMTENLAAFVAAEQRPPLADIAYTLLVGRERFALRKVCVLPEGASIPTHESNLWQELAADDSPPPVVFLFPGQGSQYTGMCRDLYNGEPVFRREMDRCFDILRNMNMDLEPVIFPAENCPDTSDAITDTAVAQPLIFSVEYALARLLIDWGIKPYCLLGHSIGEYTAACLAGVFSLEEALSLVAARGRLMAEMPGGAMMSVPLSEERVRPYLCAGVELAAVNSSELCVLAGTREAIEACGKQLRDAGVECRLLHTSHAFHSESMEPVTRRFEDAFTGIELKPPKIPLFSNVAGDWARVEDYLTPAYWARQLRNTVRFSQALDTLLDQDTAVWLEVGPGNALSTFVRRHGNKSEAHRVVELVRHPGKEADDRQVLLEGVSRLWLAGIDIDWSNFYDGETRRRVSLPAYPFDRKRYWLEPGQAPAAEETRKNIAQWCYVPSWKQAIPVDAVVNEEPETESPCVLLVTDGESFKRELGAELERRGCRVIAAAEEDVRSLDGCRQLFQSLMERELVVDRIVISGNLHALLYVIQTLAEFRLFYPIGVWLVASGIYPVNPAEMGSPELAALEGGLTVMRQEFANLSGHIVDIEMDGAAPGLVADEMLASSDERVVVYRGGQRWTRCFDRLDLPDSSLDPPLLKRGGVYVIVGGLGNIGLAVGEFLGHYYGAKLVLVGRRPLDVMVGGDCVDRVDVVDRVDRLRKLGTGVLVCAADACDLVGMEGVFREAELEFGTIDGVIFAAGEMGGEHFKPISDLTVDDCGAHFEARRRGLEVLAGCVAGKNLDFVLLTSSLSAVLGGLTLFGYSAANCFVDAFCVKQSRESDTPWLCVDWPHWQFDGDSLGLKDPLSILPAEGLEVFKRILGLRKIPRVVVSTTDLHRRLEQWVKVSEEERVERNRPEVSRQFAEPESDAEVVVAEIWEDILGIHPVGVHDDFFELGGHSLLATKLAARLREIFQIDVPIQVFFARPTVRQMLDYIEETWDDPGTVAEIARVYREVF